MVKSLALSSTAALILSVVSLISAQNATSSAATGSSTPSSPPPQTSPAYLSHVVPIAGNVQSYPSGGNNSIPTGPLPSVNFTATGYPTPWKLAPADSDEVKAAIAAIDWTLVPNSPVRKADSNGDLTFTGYSSSDPDCWWSATGCTKSKNPSIPEDVTACPEVGDWGLTYDDGPLTADDGASFAEPHLYDFLAAHNQKAGLFFIGSNVIAAPAAAQRALANAHTICVHTYSHPAMTSVPNDNVVAELYYTLKAIKEVTGVTPKCWRPPYGDVDDRVRAIAWQMGMQTVIWDEDTDDWNIINKGEGTLSAATVDGYFEKWISARKSGADKTGHIVLQHELNEATVSMAEKWLPQVQENFNVVPWNQCFNISQPYWETNFVYPVANGSVPVITNSSSSVAPASASASASASTAPAATSPQSAISSPLAGAGVNVTPANAGSRLSVSGIISVFLGMAVIGGYAV